MGHSRLAVCSWSLRPETPETLIERLAETGIGRVQLDLTRIAGDSATWLRAIDALPAAGIEVISGMMAMDGEDYSTLEAIARTGGLRPDATWPVNRTRAEMVASIATAIGLELVTFHAGFLPEAEGDPERAKLIGRLRELADGFASQGLRLGLETGQETAATLLDVLRELDHPAVGVNFDPANMILYGKGDPIEALTQLAPYVVQVHLKDALPTATPGAWGDEVPLGDGAVDWPAFLRAVRGHCPDVDLVIEREAGEDRVGDIVRAREFIEGRLTEE
jgi:sugar phosphate isomerase/epimerase